MRCADTAAAPVIEKYTGVLAAADVFTASTDVLGDAVDPARPRLRLAGAPMMPAVSYPFASEYEMISL